MRQCRRETRRSVKARSATAGSRPKRTPERESGITGGRPGVPASLTSVNWARGPPPAERALRRTNGSVAVVIVLFRSRLRPDAGEEYADTSKRMLEIASRMPGFVSFKSFDAPDGERVSLIEFESEEAVAAWGSHPDHLKAQQRGREQFYSEYRIQVGRVIREYDFKY